jgi:hypothetical protein
MANNSVPLLDGDSSLFEELPLPAFLISNAADEPDPIAIKHITKP